MFPGWCVEVRVGSWDVTRSVQPHEDDIWSQHLSPLMDEFDQTLGPFLNAVTIGNSSSHTAQLAHGYCVANSASVSLSIFPNLDGLP